ncbi:hypothetical protein [Alkalicoccobacillus gibsonii]|uniref:hypothetical protein n=1 Tax=Alkalicoccobacillus gibsonii TaxID=79881 RepID=UPI0019328313|nr:hypothetical protein [Alkalicoccobacillus gibsonii]MBM0064961.1 hypothetical protein [Alkalicoccobacillus gibsonii]
MIQVNHTSTGVIVLVDDKEAGFIIPLGASFIAKVNGTDELCNSFSQATNYIREQVSAS